MVRLFSPAYFSLSNTIQSPEDPVALSGLYLDFLPSTEHTLFLSPPPPKRITLTDAACRFGFSVLVSPLIPAPPVSFLRLPLRVQCLLIDFPIGPVL